MKIVVPVIYVGVIATAFVILPPNPDQITASMDLVTGFRIVTGFTMSVFWGLLGLMLGALWDRTKPHETAKIATV